MKSPFLHTLGWGVPALLTITALVMHQVWQYDRKGLKITITTDIRYNIVDRFPFPLIFPTEVTLVMRFYALQQTSERSDLRK